VKKHWRFFAAFALGFILSSYGFTLLETMSIIALVGITVESIIYLRNKKMKN
tara:strand:+ start:2636 stop:2791 length:156 start_codon:yes stop_codon:yes gene_type:complete